MPKISSRNILHSDGYNALPRVLALPDVLRLWDSLLSDESRRDFLIDICTAMILLQREQILLNDFADNMKMLQNYPLADVQIIYRKLLPYQKKFPKSCRSHEFHQATNSVANWKL